jgi:hypothetical protein
MNDTQSAARQRGGNSGPQRQGNFASNSGSINDAGYNTDMNQYNHGPPPPNNYESYGEDGNNYPMGNNNGGGSLKRKKFSFKRFKKHKYEILGSAPTSFTMKMRGVPFEAGKKEIFDVRLFIFK